MWLSCVCASEGSRLIIGHASSSTTDSSRGEKKKKGRATAVPSDSSRDKFRATNIRRARARPRQLASPSPLHPTKKHEDKPTRCSVAASELHVRSKLSLTGVSGSRGGAAFTCNQSTGERKRGHAAGNKSPSLESVHCRGTYARGRELPCH